MAVIVGVERKDDGRTRTLGLWIECVLIWIGAERLRERYFPQISVPQYCRGVLESRCRGTAKVIRQCFRSEDMPRWLCKINMKVRYDRLIFNIYTAALEPFFTVLSARHCSLKPSHDSQYCSAPSLVVMFSRSRYSATEHSNHCQTMLTRHNRLQAHQSLLYLVLYTNFAGTSTGGRVLGQDSGSQVEISSKRQARPGINHAQVAVYYSQLMYSDLQPTV